MCKAWAPSSVKELKELDILERWRKTTGITAYTCKYGRVQKSQAHLIIECTTKQLHGHYSTIPLNFWIPTYLLDGSRWKKRHPLFSTKESNSILVESNESSRYIFYSHWLLHNQEVVVDMPLRDMCPRTENRFDKSNTPIEARFS